MLKNNAILLFAIVWGFNQATIASGQGLELRHHFYSGELGKALTEVNLQGDSFITGEKAATQMQMQMMRDLRIGAVDSLGNAKIDVTVQRIRTQGKMENSSHNKDLAGQELQSVMFGADRMNLEISPLGYVRGEDDPMLQKLGISLPATLGNTGGFEFPTFPVEPVRIGDRWTENGQLLRGVKNSRSDLSGQSVYQLYRVQNSPQGRMGIIRYKKVTDLSGLSLGGTALSAQGMNTGSTSSQVGGLVIQLEGEIEFNIDKGTVVKTTQQGYWNMDMSVLSGMPGMGSSGPSNLGAPAPKTTRQKTDVKQNMKIKISTQFQWTGRQKALEPQTPALSTPRIEDIPEAAPSTEIP